jgi:hypothetical protein
VSEETVRARKCVKENDKERKLRTVTEREKERTRAKKGNTQTVHAGHTVGSNIHKEHDERTRRENTTREHDERNTCHTDGSSCNLTLGPMKYQLICYAHCLQW